MDRGIDHKALIAGLTTDARRALCAQSDGPGLVRISLHLGLICVLGIGIAEGVPGWPALLVPQGILLVFLFTALHETIHRTAFATNWHNDAVAHLTAFAVLLGPQHFRYFHMAHHRHTHDPANDPELESPKPRTRRDYLIYLSGIPEWFWRAKTLIRNAVLTNEDRYVPERGRLKTQREARVFMLGYVVLLAVFGQVLLWTWLIPLLLGGPFLRAYLLAEHTFCPHVANMLANTRTTFTHRLVRWVAWNMPYHAEHHAYPAVPFHKLPAFHALTRDHLQETQRGYAPFARDYLSRAAKPERGADHAPQPRLSP